MELFLLRHGNAETHANTDFDRNLSAMGRAELGAVVKTCAAELQSVKKVFVSPYLRAQQSYLVVSSHLRGAEKHDSELLVPGGSPYQVVDFVYDQVIDGGLDSLLLVSHQPLLGTLLNLFCDFELGAYHMGTSYLAAIDMDIPGASMGQLRWLKYPQL